MTAVKASELLASLAYTGDRFAVFGTIDNDTNIEPAYSAPRAAVDPGTLPATLRVDVALVCPQPGEDTETFTALLARLRDVHAERIMLGLESGNRDSPMLVALGFEPRTSPPGSRAFYLWDPELADQPREWNDARNWANPENFSKYRW